MRSDSMHYPDLSVYDHSRLSIRPNTLNIGWLDKCWDFPVGNAPKEFIEALWNFCSAPVVRWRGIQSCPFCNPRHDGILLVNNGRESLGLGTAEIRVFGNNEKIYAAPDIIYHFVTVHEYLAPDEFIVAVLTGPQPLSEEYNNLLRQNDLKAYPPIDRVILLPNGMKASFVMGEQD